MLYVIYIYILYVGLNVINCIQIIGNSSPFYEKNKEVNKNVSNFKTLVHLRNDFSKNGNVISKSYIYAKQTYGHLFGRLLYA